MEFDPADDTFFEQLKGHSTFDGDEQAVRPAPAAGSAPCALRATRHPPAALELTLRGAISG